MRNLVAVVSRSGNYLLNVGPTARGTFSPEVVERLHYVGRWIKTNGEAIYGSDYTSLQGQSWGVVTRKEDKIYLHVMAWPSDQRLVIEGFTGPARHVAFMTGEALSFTQSAQHLEVTLPLHTPDPDVSVLVIEMET